MRFLLFLRTFWKLATWQAPQPVPTPRRQRAEDDGVFYNECPVNLSTTAEAQQAQRELNELRRNRFSHKPNSPRNSPQ